MRGEDAREREREREWVGYKCGMFGERVRGRGRGEKKQHTIHPLEHPIHRARAPPARHLDVEMVMVRCSRHLRISISFSAYVCVCVCNVVFYSSISVFRSRFGFVGWRDGSVGGVGGVV